MVALGTTRDNPDYYAISVFNEAFGGGFSSRLFNDIRTKRGLAYSVGGGIGTNFGHPGILQVAMGTKSQSTIEAIQARRRRHRESGQAAHHRRRNPHAKDGILNAFIFRLDSPDKILGERMTYEYYGYPPDWLDKYQTEIKKVTAADVNRVAAKYLHKDQFAVLVVGNTKEFDKPLSSLGQVKEIDITIPPPPGQGNSQANRVESRGQSARRESRRRHGRPAQAKSIKTMHVQYRRERRRRSAFTSRVTVAFPDSMHVAIETPQGNLTIVATPTQASCSMAGMGTRSMPPAQKTEMMAQTAPRSGLHRAACRRSGVFIHRCRH